VTRVEEARRPSGRQRVALDAGADAVDRVAAVLDDARRVGDVLGTGHRVGGLLGRVVGVQRALVVGAGTLVELDPAELEVERAQLVAEGGDVLVGQLLDRLQLAAPALELALLARLRRPDGGDREEGQEDEESGHDLSLRRRTQAGPPRIRRASARD